MAQLEFKTKCPCGKALKAWVKKPTWHTDSVRSVACTCGTKFLMHCRRDRKTKGERLFITEFDLVEVGKEAVVAIERPSVEKVKRKIAKFIRFRDAGAGDVGEGLIVTDMDSGDE